MSNEILTSNVSSVSSCQSYYKPLTDTVDCCSSSSTGSCHINIPDISTTIDFDSPAISSRDISDINSYTDIRSFIDEEIAKALTKTGVCEPESMPPRPLVELVEYDKMYGHDTNATNVEDVKKYHYYTVPVKEPVLHHPYLNVEVGLSEKENKKEKKKMRSEYERFQEAQKRYRDEKNEYDNNRIEEIVREIKQEEALREQEDLRYEFTPKKIIYSDPVTIVFWKDGTKTTVRKMKGTKFNKYNAFTAALAKKILMNNTHVTKIVDAGEDKSKENKKKG